MGDSGRERDLVLAPNEYAFISDQTKGNINVYVGPYKTSLANTDQPVVFNEQSKRFERCGLECALCIFETAPEGWYITLKNPAQNNDQPQLGTVNNLPALNVGHKVNLPGPISFALWPGQMGRVLKGHHLRSNQYLVVRVYDEDSARLNWAHGVMKPQLSAGDEELDNAPLPIGKELTLGQQMIIRGTDVSFYIPPTGIEVVCNARGQYVREAVTLERLEYCILLDEDGNKRYIQGPDVVFPEPTERFVEQGGRVKYRAIELNENSGIYVKVIAPYQEGDRAYQVGDELFITGREQMIYFPRPEHAIIKYGAQDIHYAVAIPAGEGRYVLNRMTGQVELREGPCMFLPDPRHSVIVRRVLEPQQVRLWFPGNQEALTYNLELKRSLGDSGEGDLLNAQTLENSEESERAELVAGDDFKRRTRYTPPRTITLDTKYDGAVAISIWTGYAAQVVSRTGQRRVLVGPSNTLLRYDESLEPLVMSTGFPKSDAQLFHTVYLRVLHNKVSDLIQAETRDLCEVSLSLSYRVNFTGEPERWFQVENYVKFLTEHMRSRVRMRVKQLGIDEFYAHSTELLRDCILGPSENGRRPGCHFEENGMHIYDVEILSVELMDKSVAEMLVQSQRSVVEQSLQLAEEQRNLAFIQAQEAIQQEIDETRSQTRRGALKLQVTEMASELEKNLKQVQNAAEVEQCRLERQREQQEQLSQVHEAELARQRASSQVELELEQQRQAQRLEALAAEVQAVVHKAEAVSPDLIAALQAFGDKALAERMAETMAPLAILGGNSVADVLNNLLKGTQLEEVLRPPSKAASAKSVSKKIK